MLKLKKSTLALLKNHYVHGDNIGSFGMYLIQEKFGSALSYADTSCLEQFGYLCKFVIWMNEARFAYQNSVLEPSNALPASLWNKKIKEFKVEYIPE